MVTPIIPDPGNDVDHYRNKPVYHMQPGDRQYTDPPGKAPMATEAAETPSYFAFTPGFDPVQSEPSFFGEDQFNAIPTPELATEKARRFDFALDKSSPGEDVLFNEISSGGEDLSRQKYSLNERLDLNQRRANLVQTYLSALEPGQVTAKQVEDLYNLDRQQVDEALADPATFYERKFARKASEIRTADNVTEYPEVNETIRNTINKVGDDVVTKQQLARSLFEYAQSITKDNPRTWGDVGLSLIPFYTYNALTSVTKEDPGFFQGEKLKNQISNAYRMSPQQFQEKNKKYIEELNKTDPELALQYASALLGFTGTTEFFNNLGTWMDLTTFTPGTIMAGALGVKAVGKAAIQAPFEYAANLKLLQSVGTMKGMIKNGAGTTVDYTAILPEARRAHQAAVESLRRKAARTGQQNDWADMEGMIQDVINPSRVLTGGGTMTTEEAARLEVALLRSSANSLDNIINRPKTINRLSPDETAVARSEAENFVDRMYSNTTIGSRVVKISSANSFTDAAQALTDTDMISVYIGTKSLTGYASQSSARGAAKKLGLGKFDVEEIDGTHYIRVTQPVDETTTLMRGFRDVSDKMADKPHTLMIHGIMSRLRMRDSLVSDQFSEDLKVAQAYTNAYFDSNRRQFVEDFEGLSKTQRADLDNYLSMERDFRQQSGPTHRNDITRGKYTRTVGELQQNWMKMYGRNPTIEETKAYFSWKNWNDIDYAVRNLDLTRDMSRLGIRHINLRTRVPGQTEATWSPNLEGKILLEFPWDRKGDAGILIWDAAEPSNSVRLRKTYVKNEGGPITGKDKNYYSRARIDAMIKDEGYRVIHLSPYAKANLSDFMKGLGPTPVDNPKPAEAMTPKPTNMYALKPGEVYGPTKPSPVQLRLQSLKDMYNKYDLMEAEALTDVDKLFYSKMKSDEGFRLSMEQKGMPTTPHERANAIVESYTRPALAGGGIKDRDTGFLNTLHQQRVQKGAPFDESDFTDQALARGDYKVGSTIVRSDAGGYVTYMHRRLLDDKGKTIAREALYEDGWRPAPNPNRMDTKGLKDVGNRDEAAKAVSDEMERLLTNKADPITKRMDTPPAKRTMLESKQLLEVKRLIKGIDKDLNVIYKKGIFTLKRGDETVLERGDLEDVVKYLEEARKPKTMEEFGNFKTGQSVHLLDAEGAVVKVSDTPLTIKKLWNDPNAPKDTNLGKDKPQSGIFAETDQGFFPIERLQARTDVPVAPINEPAPVKGKVRVYHSGAADNTGPRWVSTDRTYASDYRGDQPLHYLDLEETDPRVTNADYPNEQGVKQGFNFAFELPEAEAQTMRMINREAATPQPMIVDARYGRDPAKVSPLVPDEPYTGGPKIDESPETPEPWSPGRYDYLVVKAEQDFKEQALDFIRFPYQEGGHKLDADSYFFIRSPQIYTHKQGQSTINTYEGDVNAYSTVLESDGKQMTHHLNQMRDFMSQGKDREAELYYVKHMDGVSKSYKDFKNQFKQFNENGHLDLTHPFILTPRNKSTWDYIRPEIKDNKGNLMYPNLENARDSEHNLFHNELNLEFALQKSDNLERILRKGTADHPVFGSEIPSNLSPMATLINTTSDMIRGRVIDDLKIKSAENFAKAYARVIDAPAELIRRDPMEYILNPTWKKNLTGDDLMLLNQAKDYRRALVDFLGVENPTREFMTQVQRTVADQLKERLGVKGTEWVDRHLMRGKYIDPIRWANNMTFDLFFGMFNIKQLAVQAMTSFHPIAVVGPKIGLQAGFATHLARWALYQNNPARELALAKALKTIGIKEEHFLEGLKAYRDSGWHLIGAETAMQDDFINQSIKEGWLENARSYGRVLFREGDRFARGTGFFSAYLEWRAANPAAKLTQRKLGELINRADTLTLNMTAASNASIAQGVGAIPLKFTTYYARLMEQLLPGWTSSKLKPGERMRAYATYSAMFGIPITAGGVVGVWPLYKEWAKELTDRGYDTNEGLVMKAFNEGLAGLLPSLIGIDHNFSESLGPTGTSWLYDIYHGKSPLFDVVTGVGGTKLEETFENSWPFFTFMANVFRSDDEKYPMAMSDLEAFARSFSSVNNVWKSVEMYNLGAYMSKNGTPLSRDVGAMDSFMNLIFGTQPSELSQAFLKSDMLRTTEALKKETRKEILKYHRLYLKSVINDDLDQAEQYGKIIKFHIAKAGFMPDELNSLFSDTISENKDFVTHAEQKFNSSTPERQKMYLDRIRRKDQPVGE